MARTSLSSRSVTDPVTRTTSVTGRQDALHRPQHRRIVVDHQHPGRACLHVASTSWPAAWAACGTGWERALGIAVFSPATGSDTTTVVPRPGWLSTVISPLLSHR